MAKLSLGIGHIHVTNSPDDVIVALGLGSCVALVLFDARTDIVGAAHCMLPVQKADTCEAGEKPGRYVDAALSRLLSDMRDLGSRCDALVSALVGGAAMFEFTGPSTLDIGARNVDTARQVLREYAIPLLASDVGGNQGRTAPIHVADATIHVRTMGAEQELVCLRRRAAAKRKVA